MAGRPVHGDVADHEQPSCRHERVAKHVGAVGFCHRDGNSLWLTPGMPPPSRHSITVVILRRSHTAPFIGDRRPATAPRFTTKGNSMASRQAADFTKFLADLSLRASNPNFELTTIRDVAENIHVATKEPEG